ncbi:beta strand repeat-containing protein, partial [Shinella zoogloeoides]
LFPASKPKSGRNSTYPRCADFPSQLCIENVTLLAGAGAANVTGNARTNVILGNASDNVIDGGVGGDIMRGGQGNDTYHVDDLNDIVDETGNAGGGVDKVISMVSFSLANTARAIGTIENLELGGVADIDATGNAVANELIGNDGKNVLDGGAGGDTMRGRGGDDTYVVDNLLDRVDETGADGVDTVRSSVSFDLQGVQVVGGDIENITLAGAAAINASGNGLVNTLIGNAGANTLDGRQGADTMIGGDGADTYYVDDAGDMVVESNAAAAGGVDTVRSSTLTYTLTANVENLILVSGSAAVTGIGNAGNNTLTGNGLANVLDGAGGNDRMTGLGGNDTYIVDSALDVVVEAANEGIDTVRASANYTLSANVENLTIVSTAGAINGTGNELGNVLTGNALTNTLRGMAGNDRLDGGGGADVLIGGAGNDTYVVNNAGVTINEVADGGSGIDTVLSSTTFDLNTSANVIGAVENIVLTGSGSINGFGNGLDNVITGNSGDNILVGGAGHDTLNGSGGSDRISGGVGHDMLFGGAGADTFAFSAMDFQGAMGDHTDDIFDYSGFGGDGDVIDIDSLVGDLVAIPSDTGNVLLAIRSGADILIQVNEAALDTGNADASPDWSDAFYIHDVAMGQEDTIRFTMNGDEWTLDTATLAFELAP